MSESALQAALQSADRRVRELERQLAAATGRAETAEARLLALQVDRSKSVKLRDDTDNVIWSLKPADVPGAINWGDLGCREVQEVINDERRWYRVIIEEADPANPALHAAVLAGLVALGWTADDIEIETACNHPENNQYCQSRYRRATMNTDTDRREATDLWTIQLREQQLRELRAQLALVERYGADQWRRGNAGREPQEFAEWRREVQRD